MFKLSLAVIVASVNAGFYWNDPAYESFIINPNNRLNPSPTTNVYRLEEPVMAKDHCKECLDIRNGKLLSLTEMKAFLKRHVIDTSVPWSEGYRPPPMYVSK